MGFIFWVNLDLSMAGNSVAIFGGGIAGLSAAHELAERGFRVTVYEPRIIFGGKARSMRVPRSSGKGISLPGEHGFRLFPAFYRHVPDTMARIPFGANRNGVADNLVSVSRTLFASSAQRPLRFPVHAPRKALDIPAWVGALVDSFDAQVSTRDIVFFIHRMLVLLTSCDERRYSELDAISWWSFMDADRRSANFQRYLAGGLTRSLVAMKATEGNARTLGLVLQALMLDTIVPGRSSDRVLNGPTNETWIDPWIRHLKTLGVRFRRAELTKLNVKDKRIASATVRGVAGYQKVFASDYVVAVPFEILNALLDRNLREQAPTLAGLEFLRSEWMNGIQFYLSTDAPLIDGHCVLIDSPWALTAISQRQFWKGIDFSAFGDGRVRGIISVDISDWNTPGVVFGRPAKECSADEIAKEVWAQMKMHLNGLNETIHDRALLRWFLDPSLVFKSARRPFNTEPLLINTVGSWKYRPQAQTEIENLCIAGDFVRTFTDLATMESANEAGRRAAGSILSRSGAHYSRPTIWRIPEPAALAPMRAVDALRFAQGLPHAWYQEGADSMTDVFRHRLNRLGDNVSGIFSGLFKAQPRPPNRGPMTLS
jgi:15-cis-phytoene desaturase